MAHLIDKDALVAEIEKMLQEEYPCDNSEQEVGYHCALYELQDFLNDIEVKEVDFGTEVYKYIEEHFNVYDDGNQTLQTKDKKSLIGRVDIENIAKHFYSLGLKAHKGEEV